MGYTVEPVAHVRCSREAALDDDWDAVDATIDLAQPFGEDAVRGLEAFSHIVVVYLFDRVDLQEVNMGSRRPRGNPDWPQVGIFAQRGRKRPNRIGVTTCQLICVDGSRIRVRGLDAIDGTPVLDIKPWMEGFGPRGPLREPHWSRELMAAYWSDG